MDLAEKPLLQRLKETASQQLNQKSYDQLNTTERFTVVEAVLIQAGRMMESLNRQLMPLLWEAYVTGDWGDQAVPNFIEWGIEISDHFGEGQKYFRDLVFATARVLPTAYVQEKAGTPILDETGTPVTVDRLLESPTKVKEYSRHIQRQKDPERWIAMLISKSRRDLDLIRRQEIDGFRFEPPQAKVTREKGGYRINFWVPDDESLRLLERYTQKYIFYGLAKEG